MNPNTKITFEHENVSISYEADQDQIQLVWRGKPTLEIYKNALNHCYQLVAQHHCHKFLIDQRQLEYVGAEAQAWLSVTWVPRVKALLTKDIYFAIISSERLFAKIASNIVAERLTSMNQGQVNIRYFEKKEDALTFLAEL